MYTDNHNTDNTEYTRRDEWIESVLGSANGFTPVEPSDQLYSNIMHRIREDRLRAEQSPSVLADYVPTRTVRMAFAMALCVFGMNCWALWSWASIQQVPRVAPSTNSQQQTQTNELNPNFHLFME